MPHTNSDSRVPVRELLRANVGKILLWSVSRSFRVESWQTHTLPVGHEFRTTERRRQVTWEWSCSGCRSGEPPTSWIRAAPLDGIRGGRPAPVVWSVLLATR